MVNVDFIDPKSLSEQAITMNRVEVLRVMFTDLAALLNDIVGTDNAESIICTVGEKFGAKLAAAAIGQPVPAAGIHRALAIIQNLTESCGGLVSVRSLSENKLVLRFDVLPFADEQGGHASEALSVAMISAVGRVVADQTGYARLTIKAGRRTAANSDELLLPVFLTVRDFVRSSEREYFAIQP